MVDFPGQMAVLMFTPGCNFRCGFCHNPDLITQCNAKTYTYRQLQEKLVKYRENWVRAVSVSGGEPTIHANLPETIRFFKESGFKVKLDTNGGNPRMLAELLPLVDYVAMDIKCALARYAEFVKFGNIDAIRASIKLIIEHAADYEFRTTVIEGIHTDEDILDAAAELKGAKRWFFQPFLPHENLPDESMRGLKRTRPLVLTHLAELVQPIVPGAVARV
jgi:pyruvate formate lyase activating enzyme